MREGLAQYDQHYSESSVDAQVMKEGWGPRDQFYFELSEKKWQEAQVERVVEQIRGRYHWDPDAKEEDVYLWVSEKQANHGQTASEEENWQEQAREKNHQHQNQMYQDTKWEVDQDLDPNGQPNRHD